MVSLNIMFIEDTLYLCTFCLFKIVSLYIMLKIFCVFVHCVFLKIDGVFVHSVY